MREREMDEQWIHRAWQRRRPRALQSSDLFSDWPDSDLFNISHLPNRKFFVVKNRLGMEMWPTGHGS